MTLGPAKATFASMEEKIRRRDCEEQSEETPLPKIGVVRPRDDEETRSVPVRRIEEEAKVSVFQKILLQQKQNPKFKLEVICIDGFDVTKEPFGDPLKIRFRVRCDALSQDSFCIVNESVPAAKLKNMLKFLRECKNQVIVWTGEFEKLSPQFENWLVFRQTSTITQASTNIGFDWKYYPEQNYNLIHAVIVGYSYEETKTNHRIFTLDLGNNTQCTLFYNVSGKQPLSPGGKCFLMEKHEWKGMHITLLGYELIPGRDKGKFTLKSKAGKAAIMLSPDACTFLCIPEPPQIRTTEVTADESGDAWGMF